MHLINSFMYRKETIVAAYEGAGWAFPTETYRSTPPLRVHHQGFEIIRHVHFPPTLVSSQLLEFSLEPNWLPSMDAMANEWDLIKRLGLWYSEKNEAFDSYHRSIFRRNPAYSASSSLCKFKMSLTSFIKDLQRDLDEEGIKLLDGRTQNNLHWFTSGDDSNKKISQVLVQTHKRQVL